MLTGTFPFKAKNIKNLRKAIKKGKYGMPLFISDESQDLIKRMI